jgi:putative membrane protein
MDILAQSITGFLPFITTLGAALALLAVFVIVYVKITPYHEIHLIRDGNTAAAISLSGATIGFAIPLAQSAAQSGNLPDMLMWSAISMVVQLLVYATVRMLIPALSSDIPAGKVAQGSFLGALSIATGLINAACMDV